MIRVSKDQLAEMWALTYRQDGYEVRAECAAGLRSPGSIAGIAPDLEATRGDERVLIQIIDSPEALEEEQTRSDLQTLTQARTEGARLHVVVAAECAHAIKDRLDEWQVEADMIHVT